MRASASRPSAPASLRSTSTFEHAEVSWSPGSARSPQWCFFSGSRGSCGFAPAGSRGAAAVRGGITVCTSFSRSRLVASPSSCQVSRAAGVVKMPSVCSRAVFRPSGTNAKPRSAKRATTLSATRRPAIPNTGHRTGPSQGGKKRGNAGDSETSQTGQGAGFAPLGLLDAPSGRCYSWRALRQT